MKYNLLLLSVIIAIFTTSCANSISFDELEVKNKTAYKKGETEPYTGEVIKSLNDKILLKHNFQNGVLHGTYEEWYKDGKVKIQGNYENGIKTKYWTHWYENGRKKLHEYYDNGYSVEDSCKEWNISGKQITLDDKIIGKWKNSKGRIYNFVEGNLLSYVFNQKYNDYNDIFGAMGNPGGRWNKKTKKQTRRGEWKIEKKILKVHLPEMTDSEYRYHDWLANWEIKKITKDTLLVYDLEDNETYTMTKVTK